MSFKSFKRFIENQHNKEISKTDFKKGEDIFGLVKNNKIKKQTYVNKSTKTTN